MAQGPHWPVGPIAVSLTCVMLGGCVQLGPDLRRTESREQGALADGCMNLADEARVDEYITAYYLTTWSSAWKEGAAAGIDDGLSDQGPAFEAIRAKLANADEDRQDVFQNALTNIPHYCRVFSANRRLVAEIIAKLLPTLGNPIEESDVDAGVFMTGLAARAHSTAKWKDAYIITVTEERPNRVVVRVKRSVYISRMGSPYMEAESSGHNEGWILTRVVDALTD